MPRPSIYFNNLNSYKDLNLNINDYPIIPSPQKDINFIPIEGRDGDLTEDLGTYKDIPIPITFDVDERVNIKEKCRQIRKWLIGEIKDNALIFNDDRYYLYKVKSCVINDGIEREIRILGKFTASFICEPFSYAINGLETLEFTTPITLYHEGYKSKPIITLYGSGDVQLMVNSNTISVTVDEYVTINSVLEDAYKGTQLSSIDGEYPVLIEGENNISWTGNITKVLVVPNWRWL